jgi:hypothetical protein
MKHHPVTIRFARPPLGRWEGHPHHLKYWGLGVSPHTSQAGIKQPKPEANLRGRGREGPCYRSRSGWVSDTAHLGLEGIAGRQSPQGGICRGL